jgi:hypothetical protein
LDGFQSVPAKASNTPEGVETMTTRAWRLPVLDLLARREESGKNTPDRWVLGKCQLEQKYGASLLPPIILRHARFQAAGKTVLGRWPLMTVAVSSLSELLGSAEDPPSEGYTSIPLSQTATFLGNCSPDFAVPTSRNSYMLKDTSASLEGEAA